MAGIWSLEDESERDFWRESGIRSDEILHISYRDFHGNLSQRTIEVVAYERAVGILAYCQKRKAMRSFLFDRIEACTDTKTGELIEHDKVFDFLFSFYQKTPNYSVDVFFSDHHELVKLLAYFFWIRYIPCELRDKVIWKICVKTTEDNRITEKQVKFAFCEYDETSERSYKQRIGRLRNNYPLKYRISVMKLFIEIAKHIKPLHSEQLGALKYMRKGLFTKEENNKRETNKNG